MCKILGSYVGLFYALTEFFFSVVMNMLAVLESVKKFTYKRLTSLLTRHY